MLVIIPHDKRGRQEINTGSLPIIKNSPIDKLMNKHNDRVRQQLLFKSQEFYKLTLEHSRRQLKETMDWVSMADEFHYNSRL